MKCIQTPIQVLDYIICITLTFSKIFTANTRSQSPRSSVGGIVGLWENAEENQPLIAFD